MDGISKLDRYGGLQRARGEGRVCFKCAGDRTRLHDLYQSGCCKVRLPKVYDTPPEAVFLNTAGGLTGGDHVRFQAKIQSNADAVLTSQACERIYKSAGDDAIVENVLTVEPGANACWLPQETILFDGGRLRRSFDVDLSAGATLLAVEAVIFGRTAMDEEVRSGAFRDRWRIRQGDRLLFADDTRITGNIAHQLDNPATLDGGRAMATVVLAGHPLETLEDARDRAREALAGHRAGMSVVDGVLITRLAAQTGQELRQSLIPLITLFRGGTPLPRVWLT